jgi:hypothetical protein
MSKEGLQHFRNYFSAEDPKVFEPMFIAQYLLVPVNTIVKKTLLPWMMKQYEPPTSNPTAILSGEKLLGRKIKAGIYLKYSILVELMQVVKTYGRNPAYNFNTDEKLALIISNSYKEQRNNDKTKMILSMDSFMTVWLLTLPEKFKEWEENYDTWQIADNDDPPLMSYKESPYFPQYLAPIHNTFLFTSDYNLSYELLPKSWNLLQCFKYFLEQNEKWSTKSIEAEFYSSNDINSEAKMPAKQDTSPGSDEEENENEEAKIKDNDESEEKTENAAGFSVAIKQSSDNENDERSFERASSRKRRVTDCYTEQTGKQGQQKKRKSEKQEVYAVKVIKEWGPVLTDTMLQVQNLESIIPPSSENYLEKVQRNLIKMMYFKDELKNGLINFLLNDKY